MMKRILPFIIFTCAFLQGAAQKITFMPQWMAQPQFAGYYVAYDKGFYKEEGVEVEFKHFNRNVSRSQFDELMSSNVQVISMSLLQAAQKREEGAKIVNILQIGQNNPNCCITQKPVSQLSDLNGYKIARWKRGDIQVFSLIEKKFNLDIEWIMCADGTELYLFGAVDGILATTYNEEHKLSATVGHIDPRCIIKASDYGYNYPSDGLYVTEEYYNLNKDVLAKFLKATMRGWLYADSHREEALAITNKWMELTNNNSSKYHKKMMLENILDLMVNRRTDSIDFAPMDSLLFNSMVSECLSNGYFKHRITYDEFIKRDILQ